MGLNEHMLNLFDGMPSIIPVPQELPPDIPVVTLRSEKHGYTCNISRSRIDLIYSRPNDEKPNSEVFRDFNLKVLAFTKYVCARHDVIRFGLVARYFRKDSNAVDTLKSKFFSSRVKKVCELGLRYNEKSTHRGHEINDVVEISANQLLFDGKTFDGILIQRDINNAPDPSKELTASELEAISSVLAKRVSEAAIEEILS